MKINAYTRAGHRGRVIKCPECRTESAVRNFAWAAISCPKCETEVDKKQWKLLYRRPTREDWR